MDAGGRIDRLDRGAGVRKTVSGLEGMGIFQEGKQIDWMNLKAVILSLK